MTWKSTVCIIPCLTWSYNIVKDDPERGAFERERVKNYMIVNSGKSVWFKVGVRTFTVAKNEGDVNSAYLEFLAEQLRAALDEIFDGEQK